MPAILLFKTSLSEFADSAQAALPELVLYWGVLLAVTSTLLAVKFGIWTLLCKPATKRPEKPPLPGLHHRFDPFPAFPRRHTQDTKSLRPSETTALLAPPTPVPVPQQQPADTQAGAYGTTCASPYAASPSTPPPAPAPRPAPPPPPDMVRDTLRALPRPLPPGPPNLPAAIELRVVDPAGNILETTTCYPVLRPLTSSSPTPVPRVPPLPARLPRPDVATPPSLPPPQPRPPPRVAPPPPPGGRPPRAEPHAPPPGVGSVHGTRLPRRVAPHKAAEAYGSTVSVAAPPAVSIAVNAV
ncbi:hypothetical protein HDU96_006402 [Phlyctochytrium bullatum]|nr:hypothetical protein HDU96_006402 [Phlyctochytrium bullatum]